jgi:hypothetical protein
MGIRSLWTTFRRSFKTIDPLKLKALKIGIDMFSLVYTHRSFIDDLLELIKSWSSAGHQITCVWDGTAPKDKQEIIEQRRQVREAATESKSELQEYLEKFEKDLSEEDIEKILSGNQPDNCTVWADHHTARQLRLFKKAFFDFAGVIGQSDIDPPQLQTACSLDRVDRIVQQIGGQAIRHLKRDA